MTDLDLKSLPEIQTLFDGPLSIVIGSSSAQQLPHFARAQGIRHGETADEIVVFVPDVIADSIVTDLRENPNVATTVGDIANFETRQFVGECTKIKPDSETDLELCQTTLEHSSKTVGMFFGEEGAANWKRMITGPAQGVYIKVKHVYNQTPGDKAGAKLL